MAEFSELARAHSLVPVTAELFADCDTPVSALLRLGTENGAFLLESVEGGERVGRYSFLGHAPQRVITVRDGEAVVRERDGGERREPCSDPLALLERETVRHGVAPLRHAAAPFRGGAIGYLAYEAARWYERLPVPASDPLGLPDAWFGIYETVIVFDRVGQRMLLVTHAPGGDDAAAAYTAACRRLEHLWHRLRTPLAQPGALRRSGPALSGADVEAAANLSRADFIDAVARCKEHILAGDIYQVQLSRRYAMPLHTDAFSLYRALRAVNPSPYMFYLHTPAATLVGASPETLVRVEGREVVYRPIAGTRRRGATVARDLAMEAELHASEKEQAEHLMLVDLGRNDLGRVCETGSVRVTEFAVTERYSHVMHLVSTVTGSLAPGHSAVDALRVCFPAGTVTGAPKLRAMEIIAGEEPERRGVYAGAVGYLDFDGAHLDTAIALRTVVVQGQTAYLQAAAGIVADSVATEEALEIDNKLAAPRRALELADQSAVVKS